MSEVGKSLVRRHFKELWNERKLDVCEELMAEVFTENAAAPFAPAAPGRVNGPSAMRKTVEWLVAQFPDLRMELESIVADGEIVAARVVARGTHLGTVDGAPPPTGRAFVARHSHWFRIEGDRLAEHWATRDDLSAMLQLGVVQPPGAPASAAPPSASAS
jgi:predicted ester cyclase